MPRERCSVAERLDFGFGEKLCASHARSGRGPFSQLALPILIALLIIAVVPQIPLTFEANARSLEPKNSRAGTALSLIMQKMPVRWEPVLGIVRASNEQQLHDFWKAISQHWAELQHAGKIKSFSTPNALALSPREMERNRQKLASINFDAARAAFAKRAYSKSI